MNIYYSIRISTDPSNYQKVSDILKLYPLTYERGWIYEVTVGEEDPYFNFINEFLQMLKGKFKELEKADISRSDISFWMIYEYKGQCNMEFDPKELGKLSKNGISLCISCYEV
jgi:hypothetical protein